jgi:hypothetical protein
MQDVEMAVRGRMNLLGARALLINIVSEEARIEQLAKSVADKREQLKTALKKLGNRVEWAEHEAVRYMSTEYCPDAEKLLKVVQYTDAADLLMPRRPAKAEVRKVIDGERFPLLTKKVRAACKKHTEWKLKIGAIKKTMAPK